MDVSWFLWCEHVFDGTGLRESLWGLCMASNECPHRWAAAPYERHVAIPNQANILIDNSADLPFTRISFLSPREAPHRGQIHGCQGYAPRGRSMCTPLRARGLVANSQHCLANGTKGQESGSPAYSRTLEGRPEFSPDLTRERSVGWDSDLAELLSYHFCHRSQPAVVKTAEVAKRGIDPGMVLVTVPTSGD